MEILKGFRLPSMFSNLQVTLNCAGHYSGIIFAILLEVIYVTGRVMPPCSLDLRILGALQDNILDFGIRQLWIQMPALLLARLVMWISYLISKRFRFFTYKTHSCCPGQVAQLVGTSFHTPKGCGLGFLVRAHTWVLGLFSGQGAYGRRLTDVSHIGISLSSLCLSVSLSLSLLFL